MAKIKMTKFLKQTEHSSWFKLYSNENEDAEPIGKINICSHFIENSCHMPSNDVTEPITQINKANAVR